MEFKTIISLSKKTKHIDYYWLKKMHPSHFWQRIIFLATTVFAVVMLIILSYSIKSIEQRIVKMENFQIPPKSLTIIHLPSWLRPFCKEIVPVNLPSRMDIFQQNLLQNIAIAYLQNPWIKSIQKLEKIYPHQIKVQLMLRKPAAIIHFPNFYCLCSEDGVRLPGEYGTPSQLPFFLPIVEGLHQEIPTTGKNFSHFAIPEILRIIYLLKKNNLFELLKISRLCLEKLSDRTYQTLALVSNDRKIIWGAMEGQLPLFSDAIKISLLKKIQQQYFYLWDKQKIRSLDIGFGYIFFQH